MVAACGGQVKYSHKMEPSSKDETLTVFYLHSLMCDHLHLFRLFTSVSFLTATIAMWVGLIIGGLSVAVCYYFDDLTKLVTI